MLLKIVVVVQVRNILNYRAANELFKCNILLPKYVNIWLFLYQILLL